jgi:hypothetical protein
MTKPNIKEIVSKYIELRDLKAQMKKEADAAVRPVQDAMDQLEAVILSNLDELGTEAFKTEAGTAYVSTRTSVTVADWDGFFGFVKDKEAWHLLNHAAGKTAVEEYAKETGDLPPGLNFRVERTVNVRRS